MDQIRCTFLIITLLTTNFTPSASQELSKKEFIRAVQEADIANYYDEDFEKAARLYEVLLGKYPSSHNLKAKLGICYLNIDGKKQKALELLKAASENIISKDIEYVEYGEEAPLDTYLYLPIAYQMNDSLDKAVTLFTNARKILSETDIFREEYINNQIRDCRYAIEMKKKPLTIIYDLFAPWLSEFPAACNPALSKNDSVFIFTQKKEGKTRIYCSYKRGTWQRPSDITKALGGYDRLYSNSITGDGNFLVLYMDDGGDGNLYFSQRKDTTWTKIKSLGKPINSIYWESHGFINPDGKKLYFSSNRQGGFGELDIWVSDRKSDGTWERPVNLGEVINTPFNEDTPFYDDSGNALLFSSAGHVSMGGYDVFRSVFRNGGWTNPVGMPYAFNTTTENAFFILNNNTSGFIASIFDEKIQSRNIYTLVAVNPADETTTAEGVVTLNDGMEINPSETSIKLTDAKKGTVLKSIPVDNQGKFRFDIIPGEYQIFVNHEGYKTDTINLSLPLYFLSHYMAVISTLIPEKVFDGGFLAIQNILFPFDSFELDDKAKTILESLKSILINNTALKIEVAGYTDSKGSSGYNLKLASKRAKAVIDYLVSQAIPSSRFVVKSFGESNFAAINTNRDGSDNPEGRKYNRRVTFGIVDPGTGVVLRQETYTPEHLRLASAMKYSIILNQSGKNLPSELFDGLSLDGMLFVRTIKSDSLLIYALGVFYNKTDAIKFLGSVKEKGFSDSYIINQYDLNNFSNKQAKLTPVISQATGKKIFTIQIKATRSPVDMNLFKKFTGVREILGEDGYYRYVTGEYIQFSKAKEALKEYIDAGFSDAFIRELNLLILK